MDLHIKITKWHGIVLSFLDHSIIPGSLHSKKVAVKKFQFGSIIGGNGLDLNQKFYLQMFSWDFKPI
ncbi:unnamed protein product [Coffea canephora]|uniref:Uncharacterized protein n=1 Tax=Coffea canephora TaxID=49390 RepID=A0A068VG76_COFCA|nr:unnamed protein product [Coffea canephora]CDP16485.1 unnamed protein product [Coffea canephora]CDP18370.1 unnamed protein product [Coffea canephora]CDP18673.1 unnamed protein product [Coffea canephora]CDP18674.1 unnamed protein product [Coffea canephora]